LPFKQEDLTINGHAIELRVNAEDPYEDFTPSIGVLTKYKIPVGDGIRVDDAYCEGQEIPIYYDPMIGKLIVHAKTRIEAIQKLKSAIKNFTIEGIQTSLVYGEFILRHPEFINASMTTKFSENTMQEFLTENSFAKEEELACIIGLEVYLQELNKLKPNTNSDQSWYQNRKSLRS
jgi:acetyl/propionyl-CoA carboxylase alpha subunit